MTTLKDAKLAGITINLKQKEITITAKIALDEDSLGQAQELEPYLDEDGGYVEISIVPRQPKLPHMP